MRIYRDLNHAASALMMQILTLGKEVKINYWQGAEIQEPMIELFDADFKTQMCSPSEATGLLKPDIEWCGQHFQERVGGKPLNPGETYKIWPYYGMDEKWREDEKFSHTYMERYWPKWAGNDWPKQPVQAEANFGIRYEYGDLEDVINLLARDPATRQAYLPIFFPEDTGAVQKQRVPCSLGYLFNIRDGYLHCTYYIRSCDAVRHFVNDLWLTNALACYVMQQVTRKALIQLKLGMMFFHCQSLHIFKNDKYALEKRIKNLCEE